MTNYSIKIPDIGEGITEVELVEWFIQVGQEVIEDQLVASVMTEKVSVEITSPVAGVVGLLGGRVGDVLAVGTDLVQIDLSPTEQKTGPVTTLDTAGLSEPAALLSVDAVEKSFTLDPLTATEHHHLLSKVHASPAVRKRAADLSLDLDTVAKALGKDQLTHADLDQCFTDDSVDCAGGSRTERVTTTPIQGVRRQLAQNMLQATQTIPHFSYVEAVDVTALELWRQQLNTQWAVSRGHLTLLPFLIRALCLTLIDHPAINARYDAAKNVLEQYQDVHIAIATQTSKGLMVPVLTFAQQLTLWEAAVKIKQLAQQAHEGQMSLATKSTITLSSLGALGGIAATPIINAPEVAILGINKQIQQPVVIDGQIQIRTIMNLSSSFDHRFIDGLHAAQFIQDIRTKLESPHLFFMG